MFEIVVIIDGDAMRERQNVPRCPLLRHVSPTASSRFINFISASVELCSILFDQWGNVDIKVNIKSQTRLDRLQNTVRN